MKQNTMDALARCPLFEGMNAANISLALEQSDCQTVRLAKRATYCLSGELYRHADIVTSGELVARMTGISGRLVEVIRIRPGDIIAPCFIFSTDRRLPVEIDTASDVELLRMSPESLATLTDTNPTIRHNFIRTLSDISSYLASKIGFLSLMTVREKVVYFLRTEAAEQHSLRLRLGLSRQRIADSFAIQKFSLLRCLASLADDGIIRIDGKEIEITDIRRLK